MMLFQVYAVDRCPAARSEPPNPKDIPMVPFDIVTQPDDGITAGQLARKYTVVMFIDETPAPAHLCR